MKQSKLSKAMSLGVRTRNAMPQYGPEWRKKITSEAGKESARVRKAKKLAQNKAK